MGTFTFQEIYEENGIKVLELDILRDNHCNFNCVFCPIGGIANKGDTPIAIDGTEESMKELSDMIKKNHVDLVYFNSNGESFINDRFEEIVDYVKSQGIKVRLFSNGYMLGMPKYIDVANKCDEVFGEVKCATEAGFQKWQRPVEGYTLDGYVSNMASFKNQFDGKFTLLVTILKNYNDDAESVKWLQDTIGKIDPDVLLVETLSDEKYGRIFGVDESKLSQISKLLTI